jgi:hypothetical protein
VGSNTHVRVQEGRSPTRFSWVGSFLLLCTILLFAGQASALPSYARQTGYACISLVGFDASLQPERLDGGPVNRYRDIGADAWYEFLGSGRHNIAAYASYVREDETRGDLLANAGASNLTGRLYDLRLNASYYYAQTYGLTVGRFSKHGSPDPLLYSFSATGSPNTSGTIFQVDYTPFGKADSWGRPFANVRVGLQYTLYDKFDGASSNYDGTGRNASDNNTTYLFIWMAI